MGSLSRALRLFTGARMPIIGLGTFQATNRLAGALDYAISLGYRHIDTAWSYGTHIDIGQTVKFLEKQDKIKREDLFITTKIPANYLTEKGVSYVVEESLEQLQTKYVDMLLLHSPFGYFERNDLKDIQDENADFVKGWKMLEKVMTEGQAKAIGVSNMSIKQMDRIEESCKIKIANLQAECHCFLQQRELRKYCMQMGIAFTGYSPLGAPTLPDRHVTDDNPPPLLQNEVVLQLAEKLEKTPAQVVLRYLIDFGISVIPKSTTNARIKENSEIFDFVLNDEEKAMLKGLDINKRYFTFPHYRNHIHFPKDEAF